MVAGLVLYLFYFDSVRTRKVLLSFLCSFLLSMNSDVLIRNGNCPECFGSELCGAIESGDVRLTWLSRLYAIFNSRITKSVFFANVNGSRPIVLKRMRRYSETKSHLPGESPNGTLNKIIVENTLSDENFRNVVLCPGLKSLHLLYSDVDENVTKIVTHKNLWLDLQISIEPLLLQMWSSEDDVPVPRYYGACGDLIAKEFRGIPLTDFYNAKWERRLFLSFQLLKMAEIFTFSHPSLIFYFTDISPDNIAVNSSGMISLVDLDHVIIAERAAATENDPHDQKNVHLSSVLDVTKLAISPVDICKRPLSDHNYFVICRYMLLYSDVIGRGLLYDPEESAVIKNENLRSLLEECGEPKKYSNRIVAGRALTRVLEKVTEDFTWN